MHLSPKAAGGLLFLPYVLIKRMIFFSFLQLHELRTLAVGASRSHPLLWLMPSVCVSDSLSTAVYQTACGDFFLAPHKILRCGGFWNVNVRPYRFKGWHQIHQASNVFCWLFYGLWACKHFSTEHTESRACKEQWRESVTEVVDMDEYNA